MAPIPEPKSCRDVYVERGWYGLSLANPLELFELAERTIEGSIQVVFLIQTRSALIGSSLPGIVAQVPMRSGATPRP
jgi:hypothetical protein